VSVFGGGMDTGPRGDKSLSMGLMELLKQAWQDPDLKQRILFVLGIFGVFVLGVHIPVPIPGVRSADMEELIKNNTFLQLMSTFGGGAIRRLSIFSLGLQPYITASIILQVLAQANPAWKKEMQEGGEYARRQMNKRTRALSLVLCVVQSLTYLNMFSSALGEATNHPFAKISVIIFWTAGAMFQLWLGEQISERGIGNGVSLMIFAGIVVALPLQIQLVAQGINVSYSYLNVVELLLLFLATTWLVVYFTTAQRRIPIQHARRNMGTKIVGGQTSYLPLSVNTAGVIPIIFAISLLYLPHQFALMVKGRTGLEGVYNFLDTLGNWTSPTHTNGSLSPVGCTFYVFLIFGFCYFYTAIQYNVEDMSDHLKRADSYIPGVRPGKQTREFLDQVISRVTVIGASFLAVIALAQYIGPAMTGIQRMSIIGGTTLLIIVSVALETLRQIEANLLFKQYGN
jgi:preprotein translocase subunit SecY